MKLKVYKYQAIWFCFFLIFQGCSRKVLKGDRENRDIRIENPYRGSVSIPFDLINNLVVIPVRINDSDTLRFVLDTGAGRTVITELGVDQSFTINYQGDIELNGLGDSGPIPALFSDGNKIYLKGIKGEEQSVVLLLDGMFNLSNFMGMQVNGLIGYDIFENFMVEIDYQSNRLLFHDPDAFKSEYEKKKNDSKWTYILLDKYDNKLYMDTNIIQSNGSTIAARLLIDSGASHSIFLYPNSQKEIVIPPNTISSYLGTGLSGEIYGEIGRARKIQVDDIELDYPIIAYPNIEGIKQVLGRGQRHGSIGADFFKRFTVIFNYSEPSMVLKPNKNFEDDFSYNTSGMEITTPYLQLPYYVISKVRPDSPAAKAGIQEDDVLYEIDFKRVYEYELNEILKLFHTTESITIKLYVRRGEKLEYFEIDIDDKTKLKDQS